MLEMNLRSLHDTAAACPLFATRLAHEARVLSLSSNRRAVDFLVQSVGVVAEQTKNEDYFQDALNYLCGLLYAHANMPIEAADAIAASNVLPGSGGDPLFHDAVAESVALAHAQDAAISRGAPAVVLSCMPRAASATLTQTLAKILGAPLFRVSVGWFPNYGLIPAWLRRFLRGGGILHDHFGASDFNLAVLSEFGVRDVPVLVRDPRAAAASYARWVFGADAALHLEACYSEAYIPWLRGWLTAEERSGIDVHWIRSEDVTSGAESLRAIVTSILDEPSLDEDAAERSSLVSANFSIGNPDHWRLLASSDLQSRMWGLIPGEIVELLELRP
jgi:hypothetical protein